MSAAVQKRGAGSVSIAPRGLRGAIARNNNMALAGRRRAAMGVEADARPAGPGYAVHGEGDAKPTITASAYRRATALALAAQHPRMNALLKDNVVERQGAVQRAWPWRWTRADGAG